MGNTRGNTYSKNHIHLDPCSSCPEFWDFGWHEAGREDLSASIDVVLQATGQDAVYYVGHSQGTTEYLVKTSNYFVGLQTRSKKILFELGICAYISGTFIGKA